ncbi:MAG: hypothetical protein SV760_01895 [Halobacteria archaeon]|nr:hypothetical protein [Halobacteria archaeon]
MDNRLVLIAAVGLVVAGGYLFLTGPGGERAESEYESLEDFRGRMVIRTTLTAPVTQESRQIIYGNGTVVNTTPPLPPDADPSNVTVTNRSTTVTENGRRVNRTVRIRRLTRRGTLLDETVVADVVFEKPGRYRYDYAEPPRPGLSAVVVKNGTAMLYSNGTVTRVDAASLGIETLGLRYADFVPNMTENYDVRKVGTETVAGVETRVLRLNPKQSYLNRISSTGLTRRNLVDKVWIGQRSGLPVKVRKVESKGLRKIVTNVIYKNMRYNVGVSDSEFQVNSADASRKPVNTTDRNGEPVRSFSSVQATEKAVEYDVLEPQPPKGYSLDSVVVETQNGTSVVRLRYSNSTQKMQMIQRPNQTEPTELRRGRKVSVGGTQGTYVRLGGIGILRWRCGSFILELSAGMSRWRLIDVAETVPCPRAG